MGQEEIVFSCAASGAKSQAQACLLAESIRHNAGGLANKAIWVFGPNGGAERGGEAAQALGRFGARWIEFEIDPGWQGVPFAAKVAAAAAAESLAAGQGQLLVWLDPDTIFFQQPDGLLLGPDKALGCRPVDHKLIGSALDQAVDSFWQEVYRLCAVPQERLFAMTTSADQIPIRPYINAGCLVVRPELGLLRAWGRRFGQALATAAFEPCFAEDILYRIFLHQAILAGVVLSTLPQAQIQILPYLINYPMHMHGQYPPERRPRRMNDLISGRYDTFFDDPAWPAVLPGEEPLGSWLAGRIAALGLATGH